MALGRFSLALIIGIEFLFSWAELKARRPGNGVNGSPRSGLG